MKILMSQVLLATVWLAVATAQTPVPPPRSDTFSGTIEAVNVPGQELAVRATVITKTFRVAADCEIVTRDKPQATLADLQPGNNVDVTYQDQHPQLVAQLIVERGVGTAAREQERWKEHREKLLTPTASERGLHNN